MTRNHIICLVFVLLHLPFGYLFAQSGTTFTQYHNGSQVQQMLKDFQKNNSRNSSIHQIALSPGGRPITVLEIGSHLQNVPAIFVAANLEGNIPLATEGALRLARMLLDSAASMKTQKWFIMPLPNPDAAENYFAKVKYGRTVNDFAVNDDSDEAVNEDGFDDLNGDGFITLMRVKSPEGTHNISAVDSRIMARADASKGERGNYKIYSEGIDNDGDGLYNEDGEGGINPGIAFPHLFPENRKEAGLWPGQTPEVYGMMRFIYSRPEIAMVYTLGSSDFCIAPPASGRRGDVNLDRIRIPARYARMFNADENQMYTMDEVVEMAKQYVPAGVEVTPSLVAGMLGLGALVNPLPEDLGFYTKFSEEYKAFLKAKNFSTDNLEPDPAKDGSFELWAYYHLGVPSFSMRLFSVPKVKEQKEGLSLEDVEKMKTEEFVALGEEKTTEFLKAHNAPAQYPAPNVIQMMQSGKLTPGQLAGMLKKIPKEGSLSDKDKALLAWSETEWKGNGFVNWQPYSHPSLGDVEIGGFVPYLETTPAPDRVDSLLNAQIPWLMQLSKKLPQISIVDEKVTDLGAGIYRLELFVENSGILPYPIAMGQRNRQPAPVIILLDGKFELLEGLKRQPLGPIGANQVKKLTWLIKADRKTEISAGIESAVFGTKIKTIKTGG
jgi:hypothetical protein